MLNSKPFRYFIACIMGLVAVSAARAFMPAGDEQTLAPSPVSVSQIAMRDIVVALERILPGTEVRPEQVGLMSYPVDTVPAGALEDYEALWALGRGGLLPISSIGFEPGEIILAQRVTASESGARAALRLSAGMRALALKTSDVANLGGLIVPGDLVDIWLSTSARRDDRAQPAVKLVAEGVRVLAVDGDMDSQAQTSVQPRSMTFEVSPEAARILLAAQQSGTLTLSLRPSGETVEARSLAPLAPSRRAAATVARARPVSPSWTVKVTRGTETEIRSKPLEMKDY